MDIKDLSSIQLRDAFKCAVIRAKYKLYSTSGKFPSDSQMAEFFGVSSVTYSRCFTGVTSLSSLFFYKVLCFLSEGSDDFDFSTDLRDILSLS